MVNQYKNNIIGLFPNTRQCSMMAMPNSTQALFSVSIINNQPLRNGCAQARNALINLIWLGNAIIST